MQCNNLFTLRVKYSYSHTVSNTDNKIADTVHTKTLNRFTSKKIKFKVPPPDLWNKKY